MAKLILRGFINSLKSTAEFADFAGNALGKIYPSKLTITLHLMNFSYPFPLQIDGGHLLITSVEMNSIRPFTADLTEFCTGAIEAINNTDGWSSELALQEIDETNKNFITKNNIHWLIKGRID